MERPAGPKSKPASRRSPGETESGGPIGPSQVDVARLANVSQAAVSRAFTPGASVAPETRSKILAAAHRLGYWPNAIARSLVTRRTNMVAIVMANMWNPFYTQVMAQLTQQLQDDGYWALLFKVTGDSGVDDALLMAIQYQVDAIIITSATLSSRMADECADRGVPVVLFNRYALETRANAVCCDSVAGGRSVAEALIDAGYQRLAFISGDPATSTNRDRSAGFIGRLNECGVTLVAHEEGDFTYESGLAAARRLLAGPRPFASPDAIFCANDLMAMATIDVARTELGLRVPEDVAVIGFDGISMAGWPSYSLTTVEQPVGRLVSATMDVLREASTVPGAERIVRMIPGRLVVRASAPVRLRPSLSSISAN